MAPAPTPLGWLLILGLVVAVGFTLFRWMKYDDEPVRTGLRMIAGVLTIITLGNSALILGGQSGYMLGGVAFLVFVDLAATNYRKESRCEVRFEDIKIPFSRRFLHRHCGLPEESKLDDERLRKEIDDFSKDRNLVLVYTPTLFEGDNEPSSSE